jgi:hypothetical protein
MTPSKRVEPMPILVSSYSRNISTVQDLPQASSTTMITASDMGINPTECNLEFSEIDKRRDSSNLSFDRKKSLARRENLTQFSEEAEN